MVQLPTLSQTVAEPVHACPSAVPMGTEVVRANVGGLPTARPLPASLAVHGTDTSVRCQVLGPAWHVTVGAVMSRCTGASICTVVVVTGPTSPSASVANTVSVVIPGVVTVTSASAR